jgi:hypothetical protein
MNSSLVVPSWGGTLRGTTKISKSLRAQEGQYLQHVLSLISLSFSITYSDPNRVYDHKEQILELYMLLNRRDIFTNFAQSFSISLFLHGGGENSLGIWNFLWQVILGIELARRLERFPDASMTGFTHQILSTLIVSDRWLQSVQLVLVDTKQSEDKKVGKGKGPEKSGKDKEDSNPWDDAFDLAGKELQFHSLVHEKQVEGLLRFAEILKWPYTNETRDYAEDAYSNMRGGSNIPLDLWDWLYGTVLPGKWAAYKIMAALVHCTPSLTKTLGSAKYYECGLSLPKQSYWRTRSVFGRVLGCLSGVKSLCGWIGPCPPIDGPHPRYIRIKARRSAPQKQDDGIIVIPSIWSGEGEETIQLKPDEEVHQWIADVMDDSCWVSPEPPVRQMSNCTVVGIRVKALPLEANLAAKSSTMSKAEIDEETEYRASILFKIDNAPPITYTLYTNPVFVTVPPCHGPGHQVHTRVLPRYLRNTWDIENLKEASADEYDNNGVLVINATGNGAEAVARAWCSERGKNAVIRRNPGPCFVCAHNVASDKGLGVNVLIWVS